MGTRIHVFKYDDVDVLNKEITTFLKHEEARVNVEKKDFEIKDIKLTMNEKSMCVLLHYTD